MLQIFYKKLKLNYINIKSLTSYIKLQLLNKWNFKKRLISVANKKYFTAKDLKMLKINSKYLSLRNFGKIAA